MANESASDTSATMEELAASMEEVSASTMELSSSSVEVYNSMDDISDKAKDGSQYAEDIKKRANDLKDDAVASRSSTYDMAEKISEVVKNALVNCKSVNEIESLTSEILEISEQTNLLALNASIEAARAGEAGKSFSVVAEEIRELADNSKNTANDIQEISKKVIDAVGNVAGNSTELVSSMDIIQEEMNKNDDISNRLMNEVDKFKNV